MAKWKKDREQRLIIDKIMKERIGKIRQEVDQQLK